jgi:uncharacterized protein DUF6544
MVHGLMRGFDPAEVSALDEPVRRYFEHALRPGAPVGGAVRLRMRGRIRVRAWLPFTAEWEGDGRAFTWSAEAGPRGSRLLRAVDRFADGRGEMDVRLLGRLPLVRAADEDTARSAAGRAAVEAAIWAPGCLLPGSGVTWRAVSETRITGSWAVPPEEPEVTLEVDDGGAIRSACVMRWDGGAQGQRGYVPCGGSMQAERAFGDVTLPSRVLVGWWFGTERWAPFFDAEILSAEPA